MSQKSKKATMTILLMSKFIYIRAAAFLEGFRGSEVSTYLFDFRGQHSLMHYRTGTDQ